MDVLDNYDKFAESVKDLGTNIRTDAASKKHGEPMVEVDGFEVRIATLYVHGELHKVDYLVDKVYMTPIQQNKISELSMLLRAEATEDGFEFHRGAGPSDQIRIRIGIVNYYNEISASAQVEHGKHTGFEMAYIRMVPIKGYFPKDLFSA